LPAPMIIKSPEVHWQGKWQIKRTKEHLPAPR